MTANTQMPISVLSPARRVGLTILFAASLGHLSAIDSVGAEFRVEKTGADVAGCGPTVPCLTIQFAVDETFAEGDIVRFGEALHEYGRRAAEPFREIQGGAFGHEISRRVIGFVRAEGVAGAGQSSWGPTCYAVVETEDQARHLADKLLQKFGLSDDEVIITAARNRGAEIGQ